MQPKLAHHIAPFARRDQLAMGEPHRMKRSLDVALPEFDKAKEFGIIGGKIIVLPDEAVENIAIIGHPLVEFRRGQPIALQHLFGVGHAHQDSLLSA